MTGRTTSMEAQGPNELHDGGVGFVQEDDCISIEEEHGCEL